MAYKSNLEENIQDQNLLQL